MDNKVISLTMFLLFISFLSDGQSLLISAENPLSQSRLNETIEVSIGQLIHNGIKDPMKIHVKDEAGRELLTQVVHDEKETTLIFQSDFGPRQKREFYLTTGERKLLNAENYKTYGRFVKERLDDFAWENDRIAQRVYGPALKTANPGALKSSAIDVWAKKTSRLVINDWYMTDHYHYDTGEGADMYTSGNSRGVGSSGLWEEGKLWMPENYTESEVLSTGPVRILFDLDFDEFRKSNSSVGVSKRISLDAGQNFNHYRVKYDLEEDKDMIAAAGIQITNESIEEVRKNLKPTGNKVPIERAPGKVVDKAVDSLNGWIALRQPLSEGELYTAIIINPEDYVGVRKDDKNELILAKISQDKTFSYWAGFAWSESEQFKDFEEWKGYVDRFSKGVRSPIQIKVSRE